MRDRKNADRRCGFQVNDVVGKALDGRASDEQIRWESPHRRSSLWQLHDVIDRRVDGVEKLEAESRSPVLIPSSSRTVLSFGFVFESNAWVHDLRRSASARRLTSSQGMPDESPASTRRARLSISEAQAASTSASSVSVPSRLASNSAATSARSSMGNAKASRRSACARSVIRSF